MTIRPARPRQRAFSLVELLVAMVLGLLLTGGMISVFAGNRASSELNVAITTMQESARYALDAIAADVRNSGYQGCLGVQSGATRIAAKDAPTANFLASATSGSLIEKDNDWEPDPPPTFVESDHVAIEGTHAISLQFGDPNISLIAQQMQTVATGANPAGIVWTKRALDGIAAGDFAIVSNCERADLFAISKIKNGRGLFHKATHNKTGSLSAAYGDVRTIGQTAVMPFRSNVYYVGDTGRDSESGGDILALYRQTLPYASTNLPTELVAGVENMRIAFGVRDSGGTLRYVTPDSTAFSPARVESVRIGLLMASREQITSQDDEKTYTLAGQAIPPYDAAATTLDGETHPVDRRHRLAFNTTVKVRNRRFRR